MASAHYVVQLGNSPANPPLCPAGDKGRHRGPARRRAPSASPADIELALGRLDARACGRTRGGAARLAAGDRSSPPVNSSARRHRRCNVGGVHWSRGGHHGDRHVRRRRWNPRCIAHAAGIVDRIIEAAGAAYALDTADAGILGRGRRRQADREGQNEKGRSSEHDDTPGITATNEPGALLFRFRAGRRRRPEQWSRSRYLQT